MKTTLFLALLMSLCFCLSQESEFAQNRIIFKLKPELDYNVESLFSEHSRFKQINDSLSMSSYEIIGNSYTNRTFIIHYPKEIDVISTLKVYEKTDLFSYVEPDFIGHGHGKPYMVPNDPYFYNRQWSHYNDGTFNLSYSVSDADIDSELAWDVTQGNPNLVVAVLDTGIKISHPEFGGRVVAGYDFVNNDNYANDDQGHGTNVAGIALADGNNSVGFAGVNWNSKIMPCKVLNFENSGYYSWWGNAIYFAVDNGAKVINLSAGGNSYSAFLAEAIDYAYTNNVSVVVSTGNQNGSIQFPANYAPSIAVGATDSDDVRSAPFFWSANSGSNFGSQIDLVAPGNYIYGLKYDSNTNYNTYWGGTSQAAPHVTGVISLLLSLNPNLTVAQIVQILHDSSEDQVGDSYDSPGWDQYYGYGRLNAFNALNHSILANDETPTHDFNEIKIIPNPINSDNEFTIMGLPSDHEFIFNLYSPEGQLLNCNVTSKTQNAIQLKMDAETSGIFILKIEDLTNDSGFSKKLIKK